MIVSDIFLSALLICIAAHSGHILLLEFIKEKLPRSLKKHERLWYLPATSVCLSIAVVVASALNKTIGPADCLEGSEVNADIGGIGVLLGLFLPSIVIVLVLFSGHWKAEPSGAKELCMANMANLLYLTVNLAKSNLEISIRDTLVACSSIDAISASISMAISDKDVLAARKLVTAGYVLQIPAFVIEGITLSRLSRFQPQCLADLHHPTISSSQAIRWSYFSIRVLTAFSPVPTVWRLIQRLNDIEHAPRQSLQVKAARNWESLPATLFTNYLVFSSLALLQAMPTLSVTQASFSQSAEKLRNEWGQSAALIVAVVAISHVCYSFSVLFSPEAMKHRLSVCEVNPTTMLWASPQWSWRTAAPWKVLQQRSPFGKLKLRPSDELLVDDTQLLWNTGVILNEEERDELWKELMDAFSTSDVTYVLDCLDRGAPINRLSQRSLEYPIHMAARLGNLDVLAKTHPPGSQNRAPISGRQGAERSSTFVRNEDFEMDDIYQKESPSNPYHRLVSKNADEQTPLGLAISANQTQAARWLLQRMLDIPRTSAQQVSEAEECVVEALKSVIRAEKTDILEMISDVWPNWAVLNLDPEFELCHPSDFALEAGKPKSEAVIVSRTSPPYWESRSRRKFNCLQFWEALEGSPDAEKVRWFDFIKQHIPNIASDEYFRFIGITNGYIEALLEMGWDPYVLCDVAVNRLHSGGPHLMAGYPADELTSLSSEALDYVLSNVKKPAEDDVTRWVAAGARNWSEFFQVAGRADVAFLETMIAAESVTGDVSRMVNAIWTNGMQGGSQALNQRVLTHIALSKQKKSVTDIDDSVELLIQHGALILQPSTLANSTLLDVLTNGRMGLVHNESYPRKHDGLPAYSTTLIKILGAAATQDANRTFGTDSALHICCKALENNYRTICEPCTLRCLTSIETLLDCGCNPQSTNEDNKTPRDILLDLQKALGSLGPVTAILEDAIEVLRSSEEKHTKPSTSDDTTKPLETSENGVDDEWGLSSIWNGPTDSEDSDEDVGDSNLEWYTNKSHRVLR